jgi:hypothetical protein
MGIKWLAIFFVMRPALVGEIDFRVPRLLTSGLRERDPLETGLFLLQAARMDPRYMCSAR